MDLPDPFRVKYRWMLSEMMGLVVRARKPAADALVGTGVPAEDASKLKEVLAEELNSLTAFNCARFRLSNEETQAWIDEGRPR